jgi:lysozyme
VQYLENIKLLIRIYPNKSLFVLGLFFVFMFVLGLALLRSRKGKTKNLLAWSGVGFIVGSVVVLMGLILLVYYQYSNNLRKRNVIENIEIHGNGNYTFGLDVSHYQDDIDWQLVQESAHPIAFVFIRATMGKDGVDLTYTRNLEEAQQHGFLVGSYHFYRPNENSSAQFEHFKKHTRVEKGHLLPVLDIETESPFGVENLRKGLRNFLELAEKEYGVKPIIYSGLDFWKRNLRGHFDDYPLWIAAYCGKFRVADVPWNFHQFTDQVRVKGVIGDVDGNEFNGSLAELKGKFLVE